MRFLVAIILSIFLLGNFAKASDFDREVFPGKYRLTVSAWWGSDYTAEFLMNSKGDLTILGDPYEFHSIEFSYLGIPEHEGPDLPVGIISAGMGSDEDGIAFYAFIAWVGEGGEEELKMVNSLMTYQDGPNNVGDVDLGAVKLEKWNKKTKKYDEL